MSSASFAVPVSEDTQSDVRHTQHLCDSQGFMLLKFITIPISILIVTPSIPIDLIYRT